MNTSSRELSITLPCGELLGKSDDSIAVWRGIPYAAPPVGPLRWRAPHPVKPWSGVRLALDNGDACWQDAAACTEMGGGSPGSLSEDCLWLNVFAPVNPRQPLPVMVWLHGGGYTIGSAGLPLYDGQALARRGVVVVSVNYRLGHFGFFSHPALRKEQGDRPLANFALLDQIAALRWVSRHIHLFGGDPQRVTLFGESAGGRSVLSLMASPLAAGLFHQAAIQSAYTLDDVSLEKATARSERLVASILGSTLAATVDAEGLRAISAQQIAAVDPALNIDPVPVTGDGVLPKPMLDVLFAGCQHPMPVLIGSNSDEASVMAWFGLDLAAQIKRLRREQRLGLGIIRLLYPGTQRDAALGRMVCRDMAFTTLGQVVMEAQRQVRQPCWRYYFDYVSDSGRRLFPNGAWHGNEIPYVFDNLTAAPAAMGREFNAQDNLFAAAMADYWVTFARQAGKPESFIAGRVPWPACSRNHSYTLHFKHRRNGGVMKIRRNFMRLRLALFKRVMRRHVKLD